MKKINVAELLKDCPKGMELDCYLFDGLEFDHIDTDNENYPIVCRAKNSKGEYNIHAFTQYGWYNFSYDYSKCVIYPKGKTTWEGFHRPFKDGDVVTSVFQGVVQGTGIFDYEEQSEAWIHVCINLNNEFFTDGYLGYIYNLRLATEEEKQRLFDAIKANSYKWNPETKTLEKLPKFKIGDRIKFKRGNLEMKEL